MFYCGILSAKGKWDYISYLATYWVMLDISKTFASPHRSASLKIHLRFNQLMVVSYLAKNTKSWD